MRVRLAILTWFAASSLLAAGESDTVRVAAIQCSSVMGKTEENLRTITSLVRQAAAKGAKIMVLPECAVQGYMDPTTWTSWSKKKEGRSAVHRVAESVPGPSTKRLADLARDLGVYVCVGLIEAGTNGFFNSQVLLAPDGTMIAHHRKRDLWTPGDSTWCTSGKRPIQVVDTEFGRLGLMICYDLHSLPPLLAKQKADIVLYSVGWYGPNEKNWFGTLFPRKAVIPYGFDIIVANWSGPTPDAVWPGRGHSCVITRTGEVLNMAKSVTGNEIVIADLPVRRKGKQRGIRKKDSPMLQPMLTSRVTGCAATSTGVTVRTRSAQKVIEPTIEAGFGWMRYVRATQHQCCREVEIRKQVTKSSITLTEFWTCEGCRCMCFSRIDVTVSNLPPAEYSVIIRSSGTHPHTNTPIKPTPFYEEFIAIPKQRSR